MNQDLSLNRNHGARALHFLIRHIFDTCSFYDYGFKQTDVVDSQVDMSVRTYRFEDVYYLNPITIGSIFIRKPEYFGRVCFWSDMLIRSDVDKLYFEVVCDQQLLVMFCGDEEISLGKFFKYPSLMYQNLSAYLSDIEGREFYVDEVGIELWEIIRNSGDLPALWKIWLELFEKDIKPEMLRRNPTCFG